jgi:hypothetical protein
MAPDLEKPTLKVMQVRRWYFIVTRNLINKGRNIKICE